MKRFYLFMLLLFMAMPVFAVDYINDDYTETNINVFHSFGLMTYGFHSNTFNIRDIFLRYNFTPSIGNLGDLQFFSTLNAYRDTHVPETNYQFILNNIYLYDYGVTYRFFNLMFISMRGAATYRQNYDTLLLVYPYSVTNNPAYFDSPAQFIPVFKTAAGIRAGFFFDHFEAGYSQGDYRHNIPAAAMVKYETEDYYVRGVFQFEHVNPFVYEPTNFNTCAQVSLGGNYSLGDFILRGIAETTLMSTNTIEVRFEEAVEYQKITFAIRELILNNQSPLFEASIKKNFYDVASLGLYGASDGRTYVGTEIKF